jgi:hypothetical protein
MIDRQDYAEAKRVFDQIRHELNTQPLTAEQRKELELHAARLAGVLLHPWFPVFWTRRLIAAAIFLFGFQEAWIGNYKPMLWWLLLPLFSPRIVGEAAALWGRFRRVLHDASQH